MNSDELKELIETIKYCKSLSNKMSLINNDKEARRYKAIALWLTELWAKKQGE